MVNAKGCFILLPGSIGIYTYFRKRKNREKRGGAKDAEGRKSGFSDYPLLLLGFKLSAWSHDRGCWGVDPTAEPATKIQS